MEKRIIIPIVAVLVGACATTEEAGQSETSEVADTVSLPSALDHRANTSAAPMRSITVLATAKSEPVEERPSFGAIMRDAKAHYRSGDTDGARGLYRAALKLRPKSVSARIGLARTELMAKNAAAARTPAAKAVELAPKSSRAWNTLGRVELAENNLEAAEFSFRRAADADEDNAYAWNNLGLTLMKQHMWTDASKALEAATTSKRPRAYMWNNLGMAYEQLGELARARSAYRHASKLGSNRARASLKRLVGVGSI